ncbi:hypothetical protein GJ496_005481 [Pomphorhynchus laevis]|nr:hypothetical protein GJ496_005481 [Pomphorhynchus laevis]
MQRVKNRLKSTNRIPTELDTKNYLRNSYGGDFQCNKMSVQIREPKYLEGEETGDTFKSVADSYSKQTDNMLGLQAQSPQLKNKHIRKYQSDNSMIRRMVFICIIVLLIMAPILVVHYLRIRYLKKTSLTQRLTKAFLNM